MTNIKIAPIKNTVKDTVQIPGYKQASSKYLEC